MADPAENPEVIPEAPEKSTPENPETPEVEAPLTHEHTEVTLNKREMPEEQKKEEEPAKETPAEKPEAKKEEPEQSAQKKEEDPEAPKYNFTEEFGEGYDSAESIKTELSSREQKIKDLEQLKLANEAALKVQQNPIKSESLQTANNMHEDFGDNAMILAAKINANDGSDPIKNLVLQEILKNPLLAGAEASLEAEIKNRFEEANGDVLATTRLNGEAAEATRYIQEVKEKYGPKDNSTDVAKTQVELTTSANASKDKFSESVTEIEVIPGMNYKPEDPSKYVDIAVDMLIKQGNTSEETITQVTEVIQKLAKSEAYSDPKFVEKLEAHYEAKANLKITKNRDNASEITFEKKDQKPQSQADRKNQEGMRRAYGPLNPLKQQ